jgi:hypothetical protein
MDRKKDEAKIEVESISPRSQSLDERKSPTGSKGQDGESERKEEPQPGFGNFFVRSLLLERYFAANVNQRVLKFGDRYDYFLMTSSFLSAVGAGVAMPLMFLVFGRLVGDLTGYFTPGSKITKDQFMRQIEKNT